MFYYNIILILIYYLFFTIKNLKNLIINSNIISNLNLKKNIVIIISVMIFFSEIIIIFINYSLFYFVIFYILFFDLFILIIRLQFLKIYYYLMNNNLIDGLFSYKRFLLNNLDYDWIKNISYIESRLIKIYFFINPIILYLLQSHLINIIIIMIWISFKRIDFNIIFDQALNNNICGDKIVLTKLGNLKLKEYQKFLISNKLCYFFRKPFIYKRLYWGRDFIYSNNELNNLKKSELNIL